MHQRDRMRRDLVDHLMATLELSGLGPGGLGFRIWGLGFLMATHTGARLRWWWS